VSALLERMRAARERWIALGGIELCLRRPTRYQVARVAGQAGADGELLRQCIVNWRGVSELSLGVPGGDSREIPFDLDACIEWLEEHQDEMVQVFEAISAAVLEQDAARDDRAKK
jgi:hypothetical protein